MILSHFRFKKVHLHPGHQDSPPDRAGERRAKIREAERIKQASILKAEGEAKAKAFNLINPSSVTPSS
ncbi:MAG: hypothetical protein QMD53_07180 [Actinomycetota bacterium]|nr:hypothetical protein [Actinomycetota bacterium]